MRCSVKGHDLYVWLEFPETPRKGDILWLDSLTRGAEHGSVVVSRVEWAMEQQSGIVYPSLTVRRIGDANT